ncbi:MAG: hypothetical protein LBV26_01785 [Bacteroidales bacterium]|nr:hypothetical protein [Bacteroidales bacterium]
MKKASVYTSPEDELQKLANTPCNSEDARRTALFSALQACAILILPNSHGAKSPAMQKTRA